MSLEGAAQNMQMQHFMSKQMEMHTEDAIQTVANPQATAQTSMVAQTSFSGQPPAEAVVKTKLINQGWR